MSDNQHLERPVSCRHCEWVGTTGHLVAGGRSPDLLCPQCDSPDIKYIMSEAPRTNQ